MPERLRALSIRQPFAELILVGKKRIEYRSRPTKVRGCVYLYACKQPGPADRYADSSLDRDQLPHGLIVGTVELVDCIDCTSEFEWHLAQPKRFKKPLQIGKEAMPQPGFFWPFGKGTNAVISKVKHTKAAISKEKQYEVD
jgi:hypothetical protein